MTYLYNTLHYYENKLRDRLSLRKKLVGSITDALKVVRPPGWALTWPAWSWSFSISNSSSSTYTRTPTYACFSRSRL